MGGWLRLFIFLAAVGLGVFRYYDHGGLSAAKVTTTTQSAAAPVAAQVSAQSAKLSSADQADAEYLKSYMMSIQGAARSYPFGATVRNISLPSGKPIQVTIQKTKTGWCPERNEPTFQLGVNATMSVKRPGT